METLEVEVRTPVKQFPRRGRCTCCCAPQNYKRCHYWQALGFCCACCLPLLVFLLVAATIALSFQSFKTQIQLSLDSIELQDVCKATGARIFFGLVANPISLPFGAGLGKTELKLEVLSDNGYLPLVSMAVLPATGEWASDNENLLIKIPKESTDASVVGLEIVSQDETALYKLLSQLQEDVGNNGGGTKSVEPMKVRLSVSTALYLTDLGSTALYVNLQQAEPMTFPLPLSKKPPNSTCTSCSNSLKLEEKEKENGTKFDFTTKFSADLGLVDIREVSADLIDVLFGVASTNSDTKDIVVSGDSNFGAQWEVFVGLDEQPVFQTLLGAKEDMVTAGLRIDTASHENGLESIFRWMSNATMEEELNSRLPIRIKRSAASGRDVSNPGKCFMETVLESVDFRTTISLPTFSSLNNVLLSDVACKLSEPRDVCSYTEKSELPNNLADGKCMQPKEVLERCNPAAAASPAPAASSAGGMPTVNLAVIPYKIDWLQSTRTDKATLRITWTSANVNAFASIVEGFDKITAPLAFEERISGTSIEISAGVPAEASGGLYVDFSMCFAGPCHGQGPTGPTDPSLIRNFLNGDAFDLELSMQHSSKGLILARILSVLSLSQSWPTSSDRVRARVLDWLVKTSPPSETPSTNPFSIVSTFVQKIVTPLQAKAVHTHTVNIPGIILGALPLMDFGTPAGEARPCCDASWVTPMINLDMVGSIDSSLELKTTVTLKHPMNGQPSVEQENLFWSRIMKCESHPVKVVMKNRGLDLEFKWNVPGGILDSRGSRAAPLLSSPRVQTSSFQGTQSVSSDMCSASHSLLLKLSNPTPYTMEMFSQADSYACATLKKITEQKTYELGCARGGGANQATSMLIPAFTYDQEGELSLVTTAGAQPSNADLGPVQPLTSDQVSASTGDGCAELRTKFDASESNKINSKLSWSSSSTGFVPGIAPVHTGIKFGGEYFVPLTDQDMTVPPPEGSCDLPTKEMKDAASPSGLKVHYNYPSAIQELPTMPQMANLLDWDLNAQAFASIDTSAMPEIVLQTSFGGGSFWTVILMGVLGLVGSITMFLCLCFRDTCTCCPGGGRGVLPCGMSPRAAAVENKVSSALDSCCFCAKTSKQHDHQRYVSAPTSSEKQETFHTARPPPGPPPPDLLGYVSASTSSEKQETFHTARPPPGPPPPDLPPSSPSNLPLGQLKLNTY